MRKPGDLITHRWLSLRGARGRVQLGCTEIGLIVGVTPHIEGHNEVYILLPTGEVGRVSSSVLDVFHQVVADDLPR